MPVITSEECKPRYTGRPVNYVPLRVYDFELCNGVDALKQCLAKINYHGFDVVGFTQDGSCYTVLFRRRPV